MSRRPPSRWRRLRRALATAVAFAVAAVATAWAVTIAAPARAQGVTGAAPSAAGLGAPAAGRALYERGVGVGAAPLAGRSFGVELAAAAAACANCHRDPRRGGGESGIAAPPLAWAALAQRSAGRPGYDAAAFARALREGVDPGGRALHALMPRYRIGEADLAALGAYLRAADAVPGVDATSVRLATLLPAAEGPLREAGQAAAAVLDEAVQALNAQGGIYGRRFVLAVWDRRDGEAGLHERLEREPPLAFIGSVGLDGRDPFDAALRERQVLNLGPLAAADGEASHQRLARPGLRHQALALARRALAAQGCLDVDAADDAVSAQVAERLSHEVAALAGARQGAVRRVGAGGPFGATGGGGEHEGADRRRDVAGTEGRAAAAGARAFPTTRVAGRPSDAGREPTNCPARLVLAGGEAAAQRVAQARREGVREVYLSAEQAGAASASGSGAVVAAFGGEGSLAAQARLNARAAMQALQAALEAAGRQVAPEALLQAWPVSDEVLERRVVLRDSGR